MSIVITSDHTVQVLWDNLTGLSRLHSKGTLYVPETAIARESGYLLRDVHDTLMLAELKGWASKSNSTGTLTHQLTWRLRDNVVKALPNLKYCQVCKAVHGYEARALADARTSSGRWVYVCAEHFIAGDCTLGDGFGQLIRLEY